MLFLLLVPSSFINAQTFKASASRTTVGVGEQFQIDYSINTQAAGFQAPAFTGFDVYSGPNESSSFQYINGNVSQSITLSYILGAKQEGTYTIEGATIQAGGKKLTSNSLTIKVVKGAPPAQQQQQQSQNQAQSSSEPSNSALTSDVKKNLFLKIIPSKSKVYQGEQLTVTVKIFTRLNLQNLNNAAFPDYNGFFSQDITPKNQQIVPSKENYNGVTYMAAVLKQSILFPQHSGEIKIDPASVECIIAEKVKSNNIFDAFFGGSYRNVKYSIKSDPMTINVMPLPDTKKSFSGAVGQFSIKGTLDKSSVKANDAINLTISVTGSGNLKLLDSLPVRFPPEFDHYDPKITDHFSSTASGLSGTRTFNYLLIPRSQGHYKIPAEEFTYFDPDKKSYSSLTVPEFEVDVAKGDNSTAVTLNTGTNKEDVKVLGQDIRYLHTGNIPVSQGATRFLYSWMFYSGLGFPMLAFIIIVFARRKYIERNSDMAMVKQRGATRMAKKRLKRAHKYIAANDKAKFYEEIHNGLNSYLSDKFTIPVSDLSKENITERLKAGMVKEEVVSALIAALDNCEFARYAPAAVTGNLSEVYQSTVKLLTQLED